MIDNSYPFLKSWPYPYLKQITASGVFREPPLRLYINPYIMQFLYLYIPWTNRYIYIVKNRVIISDVMCSYLYNIKVIIWNLSDTISRKQRIWWAEMEGYHVVL